MVEIRFGEEVIVLHTADGQPLNPGDLSNDDILDLDRPPFLPRTPDFDIPQPSPDRLVNPAVCPTPERDPGCPDPVLPPPADLAPLDTLPDYFGWLADFDAAG